MAKNTYRVLMGINYPPKDTRAEVGDLVTDLPAASVPVLLEMGVIELASSQESKPKVEEPAEESSEDN